MNVVVGLKALQDHAAVQKLAMPGLFILLGVVYATWASRIPFIRDDLALDSARLGLVLLAGGMGAVSSFPLAAWSVHRFGARAAAAGAGIGLLLVLPTLALAPAWSWLIAAAVGYGAASSCFDVAINALGAQSEKLAGRSIMSRLHAWFCAGMVAGALAGGAVAALQVGPLVHFAVVAVLLGVLLALVCGALPEYAPDVAVQAEARLFVMPRGPLVGLGIIGFCGAMAEGSVADWSGVFMKDVLHVSDGVAPLGFAAFAAFMLVARLFGDRLKDRFGARRVVALGALMAACGVVVAVVAVNVPLTVTGFAIAGAGLAAVFPFVFSAAGRHGPTALAGVASLSYSGSLAGPPLIGFVAHEWGLRAGLVVLALLCLGIALASGRARWLE